MILIWHHADKPYGWLTKISLFTDLPINVSKMPNVFEKLAVQPCFKIQWCTKCVLWHYLTYFKYLRNIYHVLLRFFFCYFECIIPWKINPFFLNCILSIFNSWLSALNLKGIGGYLDTKIVIQFQCLITIPLNR